MKGSCTLVASMLAASTMALSSSSATTGERDLASGSNQGSATSVRKTGAANSYDDKDKFAPRFDGLRFIETLVTAHR